MIDFPTDEPTISVRAAESEAQIQRVFQMKTSVLSRISAWLAVTRAGSEPSWKDLPPEVAAAAEALGFRPVAWIWWGHLPFLLRSPNFIGPEGFVKLECYGGRRVSVNTYFTDGSALYTSAAGGEKFATHLLPSGDFREDYRRHLEAVKSKIDAGVTPIYRPTAELIVMAWRIFYLRQLGYVGLLGVVTTLALAAWFISLFF